MRVQQSFGVLRFTQDDKAYNERQPTPCPSKKGNWNCKFYTFARITIKEGDLKNRNFGLDAIRAFSIILVLLQHAGITINGFRIGSVGVEIFFVLSGFLIGGILVKEVKKENSPHTLWKFWVRRWFRILPLYYLILLIDFIFLDHSIKWNILYYVFFLQNNFYGIQYFDVSWSLVIEEWFYLFVPIFIMMLFHFFKNINYRLLGFSLFLVTEIVLRFLYVKIKHVGFDGIHGSPIFRLDSLFFGVIVAFMKQEIPTAYKFLQKGIVFFAGLVLLVGYVCYWYYISVPNPVINTSVFPRTVGFSVCSFAIVLLIPFIDTFREINQKRLFNKVIYNVVTYLSLFTYAIYLIHPFIFAQFIGKNLLGSHALNCLGAFGITFILAAIAYNFFEHPILKLRERFK